MKENTNQCHLNLEIKQYAVNLLSLLVTNFSQVNFSYEVCAL